MGALFLESAHLFKEKKKQEDQTNNYSFVISFYHFDSESSYLVMLA